MRVNLLVLGLISFFLGACSPPPEAQDVSQAAPKKDERRAFKTIEASPFVSVDGNKFYLEGKPYRYAGANMWYAAYLGSANAEVGDRERLIKELDLLAASGITNLRILGASERSPLQNSLEPAISYKGEVERQDLLEGLDFALAEMAKRNIKAVIYLNNFWEWSGGMMTYLSWVSDGQFMDMNDPEHPWPAFALATAEFYGTPDAVALYHTYIKTLLGRTNSVSGVAYADDPTIMAWQLANEPRPGDGAQSRNNLPAYYTWIRETAALIKSLAPKQLVSLGSEGIMGCLEMDECFLGAHTSNGIDYATFHIWPSNWGWFDLDKPEQTFGRTMQRTDEYISRHVKLAEQMNIPLVVEEFGLNRDLGRFESGSAVVMRDNFYQFVCARVISSAMSGGPLVGSNFWAWGGLGEAKHEDYRWRTGDKTYMGDPPQEAQGLFSVFATDTSTLTILKAHSEILQQVPR